MVAGGVMEGLFTIGEFSRMTGLSVKALRFYDEHGILEPERVDPVTSYRYYGPGQVARGVLIRRLRSVEMPLGDIKSYLERGDWSARREILAAHRRRLDQRGRVLREAADKVTLIGTDEEVLMDYKIEETTLGDTPVLSIRLSTSMARIAEDIGRCFGAIYGYAGQAGFTPSAPPFILYFEMAMKEDFEMEVCAPVTGQGEGEGEIGFRTVPGGKCIATRHVGPYEDIGAAYEALISYARDKGLEFVLPCREVYLTDPDKVKSPAENVTEIFFFYK